MYHVPVFQFHLKKWHLLGVFLLLQEKILFDKRTATTEAKTDFTKQNKQLPLAVPCWSFQPNITT